MATKTIASTARRSSASIPVRKIHEEDIGISLRQGLDDFLTFRGDIVFAGLIYTLLGLAAVVMTTSRPLLPFFLPVVAGVGLLGPLAAVGFFELARQREDGRAGIHWFNFLDVRNRPSVDDMGIVAGLLLAIFFAWLITAGALYALLFGWAAPASFSQFLRMVFETPRGWALIISGAAIGSIFGWVVLSLSVVSLPMLVDCDVSAADAVSTSWRAANSNRSLMMRWGAVVVLLLFIGSIPAFVGLAFVLPWLGYSTWHLYTRLVDRSLIAMRRD